MTTYFAAPLRLSLLLLLPTLLSAAEGVEKGKAESPKAEAANSQSFEGTVLPLAEVVKKQSATADEDALKVSRVSKAKDGKIYSLVKDDASRKLFMDDRLLRRPMKITAVPIPGTQLLVVVKVQSIKDGKPYDVDYWCEMCQLAANEPGKCKCCGNTLELRELPEEPKLPKPSPKP